MPTEEIAAGLKQAIERGESLEQAKRSFINAGYSRQEVEEAASTLGGVLTEFPQPEQPALTPPPAKLTRLPSPIQYQQLQKQIQKKPSKKPILILIIILILFVIIFSISFLFKNKLLDFINSLF